MADLAPALWGIPVVSGSSERAALFPAPSINQRVQNLASGNIERWNGAAWVADFIGGLNVRTFGAIGDGIVDDTAALQAAATACPDGGTVIVPDGSFLVTASIKNTVGKNITWLFYGKILDRCPVWADITNDATLNGKGVIAFSGGRVAVIGMGKVHYDGGVSVGGVSQNQRHMFYFYNCDSVLVKDLVTVNGIGRAVGTYGCRNITHKECIHSGGYAIVVHRSPTNCTVDNVATINGTNCGTSIGNRGFLDIGVLPWNRGVNCKIINSFAYNIQNGDVSVGTGTVSCVAGAATFSTSQAGIIANGMGIIVANVKYIVSAFNGTTGCTLSAAPTFGASSFAYSTGAVAFSAGVGLTIDSVDGWTLANNIVDGLNLGTFAYSLADSNDGAANGNVAKNYNNVHIGAQLPGGLGFECVRITNSSFKANISHDVMCLYQISDSQDCDFDGVYRNVPASTVGTSDAATASFATVSDVVTPSDNIKISGVMYGGNTGVITGGTSKKIVIDGLHVREAFLRFLSGNAGSIETLIIKNSSWSRAGASTTGCLSLPAGVASLVDVDGFRAIAGAITAGQCFCDFGSAGSRCRFSNIVMKNFDVGFAQPGVVSTELRLRNIDFTNVNTQFTGVSNVVNFSATELSVAGVSMPSKGRQTLDNRNFINDLAYSAAITPDAWNGDQWVITVTNGVAFTINAPINPVNSGGRGCQKINLKIKNASGGVMGAVTFNAAFKQVGWAVPTNGNSSAADFVYDAVTGFWTQQTPWTVNVPN